MLSDLSQGNSAWRDFSGGPEFSFVLTQVSEPGVVLTLAVSVPAMLPRRRGPNRPPVR